MLFNGLDADFVEVQESLGLVPCSTHYARTCGSDLIYPPKQKSSRALPKGFPYSNIPHI